MISRGKSGWHQSRAFMLPGSAPKAHGYQGPSNSARDHAAYEHYRQWCSSIGIPAADENCYHRETSTINHPVIAEPLKRTGF